MYLATLSGGLLAYDLGGVALLRQLLHELLTKPPSDCAERSRAMAFEVGQVISQHWPIYLEGDLKGDPLFGLHHPHLPANPLRPRLVADDEVLLIISRGAPEADKLPRFGGGLRWPTHTPGVCPKSAHLAGHPELGADLEAARQAQRRGHPRRAIQVEF